MTPLRVLHCPYLVGGNPSGLVAAEREMGLASRCVAFEESPFGYRADEVLRRSGETRWRFQVRRLGLLSRAAKDFDVIHFNFGSTILPLPSRGPRASPARRVWARAVAGLDLRLLRRLGKGIVVTFQGDDVRQGDVLRASYERSLADEVESDYYSPAGDAAKRAITALFERNADAIYYLNPDLAHVLPARARFLPYAHVDLREWTPRRQPEGDPPLVVHAPSRRDTKGTRYVVDAVTALRRAGLEFRFELVEGKTQIQTREACRRANIVVDQLVAGWYGGLAVEAMALAVPVVAFVREADLDVVPEQMRAEIPVVSATPATIEATLTELLTVPRSDLLEIGLRSRAYVERWHDPSRIAAELREAYERAIGRAAAA